MFEYRCTEKGFYYFDPILRKEVFVDNTLLFLIGYARVFGDTVVSDKLYIPHFILDSEGKRIALTNLPLLLKIREYLANIAPVQSTDNGDLFELYGLPQALEQIGFYNFCQSGNKTNAKLNRVPHVPLFTKRSQDFIRIKEILTQKEYWAIKEEYQNPDEANPLVSSGDYPLYTVFNPEYKGNQAEFLDLYKSFGSLNYITNSLYPDPLKPVQVNNDLCSWFIWDSLAFTQLYQFSAGVLYGLSQLGWALMPYTNRPSEYYTYFKYYQLIDEAYFWFQNTPFDKVGENAIYNIDPSLFRIDTYQPFTVGRILSSSVDQEYLYNENTQLYSVDNGVTWMTLFEFHDWAIEHDNAYPVTSSIELWLGEESTIYPLSDWTWE